tara:strand:+ start:1259 stop:3403 length:2145 start_codon:yes stop_codon:yes gene_type:complete
MPSETENAESKAAREAEWWAQWWKADYSWDGLATPSATYQPGKLWAGKSVTLEGELVDSTRSSSGSRAATLQDYFRWDPCTRVLRSDRALFAAGLLVQKPNQPVFHILHLPPRFKNGSNTWKTNLEAQEWKSVDAEATRLMDMGSRSVFEDGGPPGRVDQRAQLQGTVLRAFPGKLSPAHGEQELGADPSLHLTAEFAAFLGDCEASARVFGSAVDFTACGFFGRANFGNARFSDGFSNFGHALFSGTETNFSGAIFSGGAASFLEAEFLGGNAYFIDAKFSGGYAYFGDAHFRGGNALFAGVEFSGGTADFSNVQFSGRRTSFLNAQFSGGDAYFNNAQFARTDIAEINPATPPDGPAGSIAKAYFDGAHFKHRLVALRAQFHCPCSFRGARFDGAAQFGDAQQSGQGGRPVDSGASFHHATTFRGAQFMGLADFARCHFPKRADHRDAAFEGVRIFESLDFKGVKRLPFSAFQGALLDKGILIGPEHPKPNQFVEALDDARRSADDDQLRGAMSNYDPKFDADFESRGTDARFAALEAGCRVLKHAMAQVSDRQREQAFFTMEMRARSRRDPDKWVRNTLTGFYGLFSDYGGAVFRPLLAAAGLAAAFGVIVFAVTLAFGGTTNPSLLEGWTLGWSARLHPALANSIELAARNMLGPLGHLASQDAPFAYAGNAPRFWFNAVLGLLSVLQTIPSLILLFLSGLALRRQFQIN